MITVDILKTIAGGKPNEENLASVVQGIEAFGKKIGLDRPHREAHYVAQITHESGRFRYDKEVWGPTAAQLKYEGRADLGNTQPGDGKKFLGRTGIQVTGRGNYTRFRDWARKIVGPNVPDFVANPDEVLKNPWEGLAPLWYWDAGTGRSLNVYADENNIEAVTRKINGGVNGFVDRTNLYTRAALVLMGYPLEKGIVGRFQRDVGFAESEQDDIAGSKTRQAMHNVLVMMGVSDTVEPPPPPVVTIDPRVARLRVLVKEMDALILSMEKNDG